MFRVVYLAVPLRVLCIAFSLSQPFLPFLIFVAKKKMLAGIWAQKCVLEPFQTSILLLTNAAFDTWLQ